jgi:hypothetical protein
MSKEYSTLAEVERCCKKIASTDVDHRDYNSKRLEAATYGEFHFVMEHEAISIYSNGIYYIIVFHLGNILTLWRLRQ